MHEFINERKKTVVFLGKTNEKKENQFYATGVLVVIQQVYHLVTAKHVIVDQITGDSIDNGLKAFFNLKDGTVGSRSIDEIKRELGINWIFHENKDVDIAIIPFMLDQQNDDVKTVPDEMFLTIDKLCELYDIFFLSYQPDIQPQKKISPIARNGTISLINDDKTFYIDGSAFPGNSGSPVFLKPSPIKFDEGNISIGNDQLGGKFLGIIGEYVTYRDVAVSIQTHRPRIIFEENTGLSRVWSIAYIKEIMESEVFKKQLNKLVAK